MNYRVKFLKVKLKSLAAEARIIRREEALAICHHQLREELHLHRVIAVREEARATHLAYAYLRGRSYASTEPGADQAYWSTYQGGRVWKRVIAMMKYSDRTIVPGDLEGWRNEKEIFVEARKTAAKAEPARAAL